ncbi:MAG: glycosyltransferase [Deltaproteobacteria bacterium]|nr:glycosyltransferase [Deltaproteobacteria bacterium]
MRIALLSFGTRGDVQPFVAIGLALKERGHDVVVAANVNHQAFVETCGLTWAPIAGDIDALLRSERGQRWLAKGSIVALLRQFKGFLKDLGDDVERDVEAATAGADAIVCGVLLANIARIFSEQRKIPMIVSHTFPALASRTVPNAMIDPPAPFGLHRPASLAFSWLVWRTLGEADHSARRRRGMPVARGEASAEQLRLGRPSIHVWSPALQPRPPDWPEHEVITGFCGLQKSERAKLGETEAAKKLQAFVDDGPPPFFIGLGSMPVLQPEPMVRMVVDVARSLGVRVILGANWHEAPTVKAGLPSSMTLCGAVDHDALFPQCAAVLHHGGSGSTSTSLRAGKPTMVCSILGDQPFWGRRVVELGVGSFERFHRLNAARLHAGLRRLLDPEVVRRAAELGVRMRAEDGPNTAADAVLGIIARGAAV